MHVLRRGDKLLVMDRRSGKWLLLPAQYEPAVRLLAAEPSPAMPPQWSEAVAGIRALLEEHRIGVVSERPFDSFNTLIVKVTKACNMACAYCYDWEAGDKARHMDPALALRAVEQAVAMCAGKLRIILHGGEPALAWDLVELVTLTARAMARRRGGISLSILGQTNLVRWNARMVEFSRRYGIVWGVSVDGPEEVNDRFRVTHEGRGPYHWFQENLARFPEFVRGCGILSTVTAANDDKLLPLARHFRDLRMRSWDWSLFHPVGRGRSAEGLAFDVGRLLASWNELFDAVLAGEFDGFIVAPVMKYLQNFVRPGDYMCMRSECGAARDLLSVSYDGAIEACDCMHSRGPFANLGHLAVDTLAEARQSPEAERIRNRDTGRIGCGKCIWHAVCGGTCMAQAGGVNLIWDEACQVSLLAFDRISQSLAESTRLIEYRDSCGVG